MRAYELLLHLYPKSFRTEYSGEMVAIFAQRQRDTSAIGRILLWIAALFEVPFNAAKVHLDILKQDLRYSFRSLWQAKGFAGTAIVVAGLGIGATTAAFSITDHVLIRPLPFPDPDRLVTLWQTQMGYSHFELSEANFNDWKRMSTSFEMMGVFHWIQLNLSSDGTVPQRIDGAALSYDILPVLGVKPAIGRWFTAADDKLGAPGTVLLSYGLWKSQFGGDPAVLGRRVFLDDEPCVIIGVMPAGFDFPRRDMQLWTPARLPGDPDRTNTWLIGFGKLRTGVSLEQARSEVKVIAGQLAQQFPKENDRVGGTVNLMRDDISDRSKLALKVLLGASLCVLLIACTNLANLLLARAMARRKELAVRSAMGAGRERLVRQLLTESLLLAVCGGLLGAFFAASAVPLFARLVPTSLPISEVPSADWRVLIFAALATIVTGIAFGVIPALTATKSSGMQEGSRSGVGGRKETLRGVLVIAEVAASVVLLISSGLLIRALWQVQQTDPGFRSDHVMTMRTALPMPRYESTAKRAQFYDRVLSEVRALPGVKSAAYTSFLPIVHGGGIFTIEVPGRPKDPAQIENASMRFVTPGYFSTLGIPIKIGRDVSDSDTFDALHVAVVSESFAKRYWPNESPLGRHFKVFGWDWDRTIVGVVGDVHVRGLERSSEPQVYFPNRQVPDSWYPWFAPKDLAVRTEQDPTQLTPAIRRIVASADPQQPISAVQTLEEIVSADTAARRTQVVVLGAFAAIAFLLAGIGIHGVLSFTVSRRTQEIGVRMALGATRGKILTLIAGEAAVLAAIGIVVGIIAAYGSGRVLESLLAGVKPHDAETFAAGVAVSLLMAIIGSIIPAARAVRIDPAIALRAE